MMTFEVFSNNIYYCIYSILLVCLTQTNFAHEMDEILKKYYYLHFDVMFRQCYYIGV